MSIVIRPAGSTDVFEIRSFNERVAGSDEGFSLPESAHSLGYERRDGRPVWHEIFVAVGQDGVVRGGYALKRELLFVSNDALELRNYQIPLSEGMVNRTYAMVGIRLLQDALARHTYLYCLGMGSLARPLPRLLERFKWKVEEVPFLFRVLGANRFLKNIEFLRARRGWRLWIDIARVLGAGALGVLAWRLIARVAAPRFPPGFEARDVPSFGAEVEDIFVAAKAKYGALIERTSAALAARYPASDPRLIRLVLYSDHQVIGWLVLTRSDLQAHRQFGNMRLGSIVDGLCEPSLVPVLIRAGVERLAREHVDLIVTNQSSSSWLAALRRNGFLSGPSNFIFARSPALAESTPGLDQWHLNRGDGDGPINL